MMFSPAIVNFKERSQSQTPAIALLQLKSYFMARVFHLTLLSNLNFP